MKKFKRNGGSAILTALFIMMLIAIAATAMSLRLQIDINRTQLIQSNNHMMALSQKATFWAIEKLTHNAKKAKPQRQYIDKLPIKSPEFTDNQFRANVKIIDLQGLFNINNVRSKKMIKTFAQLLLTIIPKLDRKKALVISRNLRSFISPVNLNKGHTRTDSFYRFRNYFASHTLMVSKSELRLVKGINKKRYLALAPYITALPTFTPINVNTASGIVLQTLGSHLSHKQAEEIIKIRNKTPFTNARDFLNHKKIKTMHIGNNQITVRSEYFLVSTEVSSQEYHFIVYSLLRRTINRKAIRVKLIQQSINTI